MAAARAARMRMRRLNPACPPRPTMIVASWRRPIALRRCILDMTVLRNGRKQPILPCRGKNYDADADSIRGGGLHGARRA